MINHGFPIIVFFLLAGINTINYAQKTEWEKLSSPVSTTLTNLSFVNSTTGWASGQQGTIIKTSDGGTSWQIQNSTIPYFITDIFFVNENYGWAVTVKDVFPFNTLVLKTTNGGEEWIAENFQDSSALMRTIFFFDSLHGFIGGSYIAETSDGGNSWTKAAIDSSFFSGYPIYNFNFYSEQFGYACGGAIDIAGIIWRTTDFGKNWTATGVSPDQVFDLFIFDSLNAITLSGDPEGFFGIAKIKSTDGGLSWGYEDLSIFGLTFAVDFRTANEGWSASGFKFLFSSDAGETWTEKSMPDSAVIYGLQFTDSLTGFAVGADGVILKYFLSYEPAPQPTQFILYQNYPNPFNSSTVISWQQPLDEFVTIKIYNSLGEEMQTVVNEYLTANTYSINFTPKSALPSGIYYYRIRAGQFSEAIKMVYLK